MRPQRLARWSAVALVLVIGGLVALAAMPPSTTGVLVADPAMTLSRDDEAIGRGEYLARQGNCAGCHTARGGVPFAGGRGIATPFGTVYAGNLTPDDETGLGRWTAEDFWRAMHEGRSRNGRALVPAFPYTEFTKVTRADSDALWVYLRSLPAVVRARPAHELRFPYNTALAIEAWRAIYFDPGVFVPDPTRSPEWNRGAYLAQGLGHCAACHAPRDRFGGRGREMSGGLMADEGWWAPALTASAHDAPSMIALLKTGQSAIGTAMGPMAAVVVQSTQHWSDEDLTAITGYLQSLPAAAAQPAVRAGLALPERGRRLYHDRCADCHGEHGQGLPGIYPPLAGNPSVLQPTAVNLVHAVRHGGFAPATHTHPRPFGMPPNDFDEATVADLLTYIRGAWGNDAPAVSALQVLRAR